MDAEFRAALQRLLGPRVELDVPLARYTSLRVGGPADALARPASRDELARTVELARAHGARVCVLGKGFNALAPDAGVRDLVLQLGSLRALSRDAAGRLRAEAGVTHSSVARFCAGEALEGLEFAVGIPGTVGGWLRMNAGIPEREMKDVTRRVELLDAGGGLREVAAAELEWRYRELVLPPATVVVGGEFATRPGDRERIRARMDALLARRRATQPVNEPSCGSVFKNPPGDRAGRLIEAAGLKGARAGGAEISSLHANFIVNRGGATARDVLELIERARAAVRERFGVALETEVHLLGGEGAA